MQCDARQFGYWAALSSVGILLFASAMARAEEAAAGTTAVKAEVKADAKADGEKPAAKSALAGLGQRGDREVGPGDELSFRQSQVAEEMRELEERMFRLSETLKMLEPENSSRLMLGLKYAREELIRHQMEEMQDALAKLSLKGAVDDQRQLLAKLERLQQLLLSTDLDFEMKLERLRAIREVLRKLDAVIKEESREEKESKKAAEKEKELAELAKRRETLESLIKQQGEHIEKNTPLAKEAALDDGQKADAGKLGEAQESTRKEAKELNKVLQDGAASKPLTAAVESMQSAVDSLAKPDPAEALPPMQKALAELKRSSTTSPSRSGDEGGAHERTTWPRSKRSRRQSSLDRRSDRDDQAVGQQRHRRLGRVDARRRIHGRRRKRLWRRQGGQGNGDQGKALAALKYAEELLAEEAERLARQLRREVKKRVTDGLTAMLEEQTIVRKRTETLAPGVKEGSRQALSAVTALAKREEKITGIAQDLINIVEETEFGIALPAALAAVRDATESVQMSLTDGDASTEVVVAEKQIEADLLAMLEVVSEMSDANSRRGRANGGGNANEEAHREQNRIISELKMIQLLELRVQQNTSDVDAKRAAATAITPALRKRIEDLEGRQDDIRDATERLAEERGDDLPQP